MKHNPENTECKRKLCLEGGCGHYGQQQHGCTCPDDWSKKSQAREEPEEHNPEKPTLIGYNCKVCHGTKIGENDFSIVHVCDGILEPVYTPQPQATQEKKPTMNEKFGWAFEQIEAHNKATQESGHESTCPRSLCPCKEYPLGKRCVGCERGYACTCTPTQESWEEKLHMICIDAWANINDTLQKHGVKYKGDGIGTAYGGWTALCNVVEPRVKALLAQAIETARQEGYRGGALDPRSKTVMNAIETAIKERDAHHKSLRAKELGEIHERMDELEENDIAERYNIDQVKDYQSFVLGYQRATDEFRTILDELIEKPVK
jgi:hypothetical protein